MEYVDTIMVPLKVKCTVEKKNGMHVIHSISFPKSIGLVMDMLDTEAKLFILDALTRDATSYMDDMLSCPFKEVV